MSLLRRVLRLEALQSTTGRDDFADRLEAQITELGARFQAGWRPPDEPEIPTTLGFKEKMKLIQAHDEECDRDWERFCEGQRGDHRPGHGDLGSVPGPTRGGTRAAGKGCS